jgi:predicted phage gp36 major capsid-like protein
MPSRADRFEANAEQCLIEAERTTSEKIKAEYLNLAREWQSMAADARALEAIRRRLKADEPPRLD